MPKAFLKHQNTSPLSSLTEFHAFILLLIRPLLSKFSLANFTYTLNHTEGKTICRLASSELIMCGSRSNLSLVESSQVPCSGKPVFQYNSLNKALDIIKSRRILLAEIKFSGTSEVLIVHRTVHLSQIKIPLQKNPLEIVENVVVIFGSGWSILSMRQQNAGPRNWQSWWLKSLSASWGLRRHCKDFLNK